MAEAINVNSVQPSEVSSEMVAYLLTASILGGADYGKGYQSVAGIPIILGFDKQTILETYAECIRTVSGRQTDAARAERAARR